MAGPEFCSCGGPGLWSWLVGVLAFWRGFSGRGFLFLLRGLGGGFLPFSGGSGFLFPFSFPLSFFSFLFSPLPYLFSFRVFPVSFLLVFFFFLFPFFCSVYLFFFCSVPFSFPFLVRASLFPITGGRPIRRRTRYAGFLRCGRHRPRAFGSNKISLRYLFPLFV